MEDAVLRPFHPDDAAWLVEQHGLLYARDEGFDDSFAPLVASILDDFMANSDPELERGWIAEQDGQRLGSIFCVAVDRNTAKLRLFLLVPQARGLGLGKRLLQACTAFARGAGYKEMVLWTHESHTAACALYKASGWELTDSKAVHSFGVDLVEQSWKFRL
ncbi:MULTISPECIES: GNAT family N-acetyltransferase [unclassified Ruegeria]|uniref:GNAT family N-acetyltransferase n=1 Tax=unclassified Ruegeria TaxID=2625375 RepID=UPI001488B7E4|nr:MULTISPECIES: GNAT family N-acetyltransferase [unclassified Ruegeria]NOC93010.1 GNAT family N-acetyltransferase [Ruegeria sp. HKCCD6604]